MRTHMSHATALAYDRAGAGKKHLIRRYLFTCLAIVSAGAITVRAQAQALEDQRASEEEARSKQRDAELQRLRAD